MTTSNYRGKKGPAECGDTKTGQDEAKRYHKKQYSETSAGQVVSMELLGRILPPLLRMLQNDPRAFTDVVSFLETEFKLKFPSNHPLTGRYALHSKLHLLTGESFPIHVCGQNIVCRLVTSFFIKTPIEDSFYLLLTIVGYLCGPIAQAEIAKWEDPDDLEMNWREHPLDELIIACPLLIADSAELLAVYEKVGITTSLLKKFTGHPTSPDKLENIAVFELGVMR